MKNKRKKQNSPYAKLLVFSGLILAYVIFILVGTHGLITLWELKSESALKTELIRQLRTELLSTSETKEKLSTDKHAIERLAREKYNMIKSGETIYKVERR